jgi:dTDP-glucose 4,6-dehydratase
MKVIVTGGAGFIGSSFINHLKENYNVEIVCVDKMTYCANKENIKYPVEFIEKDIIDVTSEDLGEFDYIVNFAAETHVDNSIADGKPFIKSNIEGVFNLLEISRKNPKLKKFVQISTDEVYGDMKDYGVGVSATEEFDLQPSSYYSATKAAADLLVKAANRTYGLPYLITRTCNNYGDHQFKEKFLPKIHDCILNQIEIPVYGDGSHTREWIWSDDNARYIAILMFEPSVINEVVNIGSGIKYSNNRIIELIQDEVQEKHVKLKYVDDRLGHDRIYSLDSSKLRKILKRIGQNYGIKHIMDYFEKKYGTEEKTSNYF